MPSRDQILLSLRTEIADIQEGRGHKEKPRTHSNLGDDCVDAKASSRKPLPTAFDRIERLCSRGYKSKASLRRKLLQEGFELEEINRALERAERCLLVDDLRYADIFIRESLRKRKGVQGIANSLSRDSISISDVPGWPEDYLGEDESFEVKNALAVLQSKPITSKNPRATAYRRLMQKGYSSSVANAAMRLFFA